MESDRLSFYFCGIGGCGMDPLARLMARDGYVVRGSDIKESPELEKLRMRNFNHQRLRRGNIYFPIRRILKTYNTIWAGVIVEITLILI